MPVFDRRVSGADDYEPMKEEKTIFRKKIVWPISGLNIKCNM
jgi:hypothetical protein